MERHLFRVDRKESLPSDGIPIVDLREPVDLATYEGRYPGALFNKGVRTQDEEHIGHI
jgi:hypothetical protein